MGGESHISGCSSVTTGSSRRRVFCKCGVQAPLVTTWSNENGNIGRRFYGCGKFQVISLANLVPNCYCNSST